MNTSSMKQSGMVFESNALLKVNGWVPMSLKPLPMQSLKTTTLDDWMITKNKNPGCTVLTRYKLAEQENEDSNDNHDKWIFCSDFDQIEITLLKDDGGAYELVFNEGPTKRTSISCTNKNILKALHYISWQA
jgi:hypothetical protein